MTEEAKKRYEEKTKRFYTTVDLKEPDRVPIQTGGEMYSIMQLGYTVKECIYDKTMMKAKEAAEYFMLIRTPWWVSADTQAKARSWSWYPPST